MRVQFTDGPDAVDIHTPRGVVRAERGKPVDVPAPVARNLIRAGWSAHKPEKGAKS